MLDFLARVGRVSIAFLAAAGRLALFTLNALSHCLRPPFYPRLMARQLIDIGYYSLPVVGLTALFTGMVLALQSNTGFSRINAQGAIALIVALSYLGLGIRPPQQDWGGMLSDGIQYVNDGYWWLIFPAGLCIVLVISAPIFIGEGLRDAVEVRLQRR